MNIGPQRNLGIAVVERQKHWGGVGRAVTTRGRGREALRDAMLNNGEVLMASTPRLVREARAKTQPRFRIGDGEGLYLALDGQGVTDDARRCWFGSEAQAGRALGRFPRAKGMKAIPIVKYQEPAFRARPQSNWGA